MTVLIIIWLYESVSIPAAKAAQAASSNTNKTLQKLTVI